VTAIALSAANVRSMWRRFIGLTALIAIAVALCATAFAVSGSAERAAHDRVQEGSANRTITVDRWAERADSKPLGDAALRQLVVLPHVLSLQPRAQVSFGYKDAQVPGVLLYATTVRPALTPPVTRSLRDKLFPLNEREIILPSAAQGSDLTPLLGKTITVQTTRAVANGQGTGADDSVRVVGLFDRSWQLDGPDTAYADDATVIRWAAARAGVTPEQFTNSIGYDRISVVVDAAQNVPDVLSRPQEGRSSEQALLDQYQGPHAGRARHRGRQSGARPGRGLRCCRYWQVPVRDGQGRRPRLRSRHVAGEADN
jgi:putative ABC transport system permease protein